jgi:hypothetical protein
VSVLLQECWWRALATTTTGLAGSTAAVVATWTPPQLPQHPSKFCPPYHQHQAYGAQVTDGVPSGALAASCSLALHVLLVAQLWEVWPWQVARLQLIGGGGVVPPARGNQAHGSSSSSAASSSKAGAAASGDGSGGDASTSRSGDDQDKTTGRTPAPAAALADAIATSTSRIQAMPEGPAASLLGSTRLAPDPSAWAMLLRVSGMEWPLLPDQGLGAVAQQEGQGPPPVSLQQLQLAVTSLANCAVQGAVSAHLLLALLLQRADPGLRASFLGGPGGTALLAAAQYWGHTSAPHAAPGVLPFSLVVPIDLSERTAARRLLAVLRRDSRGGAPDWALVGPCDSLGLLLAWCYLVPVRGWEAVCPPEWGPVRNQVHLVMTVHHLISLEQQEICMPGGSPLQLGLPYVIALSDSSSQGTHNTCDLAMMAEVHADSHIVWL